MDKNLKRIIDSCNDMLELADHGDKLRRDAGCGALHAALRDSVYQIRNPAKDVLDTHAYAKKPAAQKRQ